MIVVRAFRHTATASHAEEEQVLAGKPGGLKCFWSKSVWYFNLLEKPIPLHFRTLNSVSNAPSVLQPSAFNLHYLRRLRRLRNRIRTPLPFALYPALCPLPCYLLYLSKSAFCAVFRIEAIVLSNLALFVSLSSRPVFSISSNPHIFSNLPPSFRKGTSRSTN